MPFENLRDGDDDEGPAKIWTIHHFCLAIDLWVKGDGGDECAERWNALNASQHSAQGGMRMATINEMDMPAPDTIVNCKNGGPIAAMFFYAAAEQDLGDIAAEHGFETRTVTMEEEDPDDVLSERWFNGDEQALEDWAPSPQEGWTLAAKLDTEDGAIAIFIKPGAVLAARRATECIPQETE